MSRVLELRGLVAGYRANAILHGVDLHVDAGEVVALLGANGAGKTTLLRAAIGELSATAGTVEIIGAPLGRRSTASLARAGVTFVPQERGLLGGLTARENLLVASRGPTDRAAAVLELFGELEPRLDARAGLLSGGEQQMLALGRALITAPRLLLVDELSLGLAPRLVRRILPTLRTAARDHGAGVLFVEQHVGQALEIADRAYILRQGRVVFEGPAAELARRPDLLRMSYLGADLPSLTTPGKAA